MKRNAISFSIVTIILLVLGYACNMVDQVATPGSKLVLTAQPTSIGARGFSTLTVVGTRGNGSGAPLADGTVIHFDVGNAGTVTPNPVETTDGKATAIFHAANFSGTIKVTASSGGIDSATVDIVVGEARVGNIFVSANPPTLPVEGGQTQIKAVVVDTDGNQLGGVGVQFSATDGTLRSGGQVQGTNQNGVVNDVLTAPPCITDGGCTITVTATTLNAKSGTVDVKVGAPSTINCDFEISPSAGAPGDRINFIDTSTDTGGSITSFQWNFGDSSSGSGRTAQHIYRSEGTFSVTHTVVDDQGTTAVCAPKTVTITANESGLQCNIAHSPESPGKGERVTFDASQSSDSNGRIIRYEWNFGDGPSTVTESDPITTHVYSDAGTFTVTLTITDDEGNSTSCIDTVTVEGGGGGGGGGNLPPTCSFSATQNPSVAHRWDFNASSSSDSDGSIVSYSWDFDGNSSIDGTGVSVSHTYSTAGTYDVILAVKDNNGATTTCSQSVTVVDDLKPSCSFTISPNPGSAGNPVNFNASASTDTDGTITTYDWDFGDSSTFSSGTPTTSHTYGSAGGYTVVLTVTDDGGATNVCSKPLTVN